ncbi:MAG: phenylacetate--CoA ligase family protein [Rhodocyclales bacterium]|nr:phenylacetate--CoA ligase family protein [Rhodocyclales bacterium]
MMPRSAFSLGVGSALPGLRFPALPAAHVLPRLAMFQQIEASQWLAPEALRDWQFAQLDALLRHVRATVPGYGSRLAQAGLDGERPCTPADWARLPLLTRRDLQSNGRRLASNSVPVEHGAIVALSTSGSTGEPVEVLRSGLDQLMWQAIGLRDHAWHGRDLAGTLCVIRAGVPAMPDDKAHANWGAATADLFATGPCHALSIDTDVSRQAAWLRRHDPHYLLSYPSNLAALLDLLEPGALPRLREVRSIGEMLPQELRDAVLARWGVPVVDHYSCNEVGSIALQCPVSGLYHVQSESLLVEVLDAQGAPCAPGAIGSVVLTTLHGFAQPLLRYELRDHAEVGPACPCGRGLPTLRRIVGRTRNMLTLPGGEKRWPLVGFAEYRAIAPIRQYQMVQTSLDALELRLVVERPLSAVEEAALTAVVQRSLGHPFALRFDYRDRLLPAASGKSEEFLSLIAD